MTYHWNVDPTWKHINPLTVQQAAALMAGFDPHHIVWTPDSSPACIRDPESGIEESCGITRIKAKLSLLTNAINSGELAATIRRTAWERGWDEIPEDGERFANNVRILDSDAREAWPFDGTRRTRNICVIYRVEPNWERTTVSRAALVSFLIGNGIEDIFFNITFGSEVEVSRDDPDFMNPDHPRYSPKLAAAVSAWRATDDPGKRTPKTAMENWLTAHREEFGLSDTAIGEISKVANWETKGGAPKS